MEKHTISQNGRGSAQCKTLQHPAVAPSIAPRRPARARSWWVSALSMSTYDRIDKLLVMVARADAPALAGVKCGAPTNKVGKCRAGRRGNLALTAFVPPLPLHP